MDSTKALMTATPFDHAPSSTFQGMRFRYAAGVPLQRPFTPVRLTIRTGHTPLHAPLQRLGRLRMTAGSASWWFVAAGYAAVASLLWI
jgi:hypothetical protein